jgi:hypothetical protein
MRVLELTADNKTALHLGLEYLIGISYVDDTEVFKVGMLSEIYFSYKYGASKTALTPPY